MSESYAVICLLGVMDRLWFNQTILFQEPNSIMASKTLKTAPLLVSDSFKNYETSSMYSIPEEEKLSVSSACLNSAPQDESEKEEETELKQRATRSKVTGHKSRSKSSSPSTPKRSRNLKYSSSITRLQKTMSCKTLSELEEEEVKGFIDLGFSFNKENICPRMISVLPGLQRLAKDDDYEFEEEGRNNDDEEENDHRVLRPYLSEAWLVRRPDSPLLNLSLPKVSTVAEMKKHLKYWARAVASEIHQEP